MKTNWKCSQNIGGIMYIYVPSRYNINCVFLAIALFTKGQPLGCSTIMLVSNCENL